MPHLLLLHTYSPIHSADSVDVALACASESLADGGLWSNLGLCVSSDID